MTLRSIPFMLLVLALTAVPMLPGGRVLAADETDIATMIANAKTHADHEAIAAYFDKQAAAARAKAEEHQKMGEAYKKEGGPLAKKTHFHEHCEALVRSYLSEAKEYEALAAAHRAMARSAKE